MWNGQTAPESQNFTTTIPTKRVCVFTIYIYYLLFPAKKKNTLTSQSQVYWHERNSRCTRVTSPLFGVGLEHGQLSGALLDGQNAVLDAVLQANARRSKADAQGESVMAHA